MDGRCDVGGISNDRSVSKEPGSGDNNGNMDVRKELELE